MSARIVPFLATLLLAAPAVAGTVVIFDTGGPGGALVHRMISDTLNEKLADHVVIRKKRPRSWKAPTVRSAAAVAKAVAAAGADAGVDSMVHGKKKKRKLNILAVSADGTVLFDKSMRLPRKRPGKKVAGLTRNIARALADQLRDADTGGAEEIAATETIASDPSSGSSDIVKTSSAASSTGTSSTFDASPLGVPKVAEEAPRHTRRRGKPFHFALRVGGGVLSYHDNIATNIEGGELDIKLGFTVVQVVGLDAEILNLVKIAVVVRHYAAKMTHEDPNNLAVNDILPKVIDVSVLGATGLVGAAYEVGPMSLGGMVGVAYDALDASAQTGTSFAGGSQEKVALVPSWTRLLVLAGLIINYGNLGSEGLTAQVGLMGAPWGSHAEEPVTSGASSTVYGGVGWLRLRFQMPTMLGAAGGLFVEAGGDVEWVKTKFSGNGTRKALGTITPVQASNETRLQFSGSAAFGYVF